MIAIYYVALIILICPLNTVAFNEVTAVESQVLNRRRNTHQYRNRNERSRIFNENNADVLVGHMPKIELHAHLHVSRSAEVDHGLHAQGTVHHRFNDIFAAIKPHQWLPNINYHFARIQD
jgi:hypothetical protein